MKQKNGFTLIELLAVIVILSLIALIATPIILNIVDNIRGKARIQSANGVLNSARYFYTESLLDTSVSYPASGLEFICNGNTCEATVGTTVNVEGTMMLSEEGIKVHTLSFNGKAPTSGSIIIYDNGTIKANSLAIDSHVCTYDETKKIFTEC